MLHGPLLTLLSQDPIDNRIGHVSKHESLTVQGVPRKDLVLADKKSRGVKSYQAE